MPTESHNVRKKGPGKAHRIGISLPEFFRMFPDDEAARLWFEEVFWPDGNRFCPRCDSENTKPASHPTMPYRCSDCRKHFSVRIGTVMESSKVGFQNWALYIYLMTTNIKGISSMKAHRDLNVRQPTAWFMGHRIREAMDVEPELMEGPVEVDETFIGGKERNKHFNKRLHQGRGAVGKAPVAGIIDRETREVVAKSIPDVRRDTLHKLIRDHVKPGSTVYTDEHRGYQNLDEYDHHGVKHGAGQYVDGDATTNSIENFWSILKRGYHGVYHKMSRKHLHRYATEFAERHNIRDLDTIEQMKLIALGMAGKRLRYRDLVDGG